MSSINNFFDTVPFSISGIQNLAVDTINGNTVLTTINIAGQIAYLSWDSTTNTLTLSIPNATSGITGLLTSTDWNTFNNKENLLTFVSPLTRVGSTISFDFTQSLTFNGNTQTLNNNTIVGGGLFYTGATSNTTAYILYIDNSTGYITKGAVPPSTDLLPLDNTWTGTQNYTNNIFYTSGNYYYTGLPNAITTNSLYVDPITGQLSYGSSSNLLSLNNTWTGTNNFRLVRIENLNDVVGDIVLIFTNSLVNDYWFFNSLGGFGFIDNVGGLKWIINKDGTSTFYGFMGVNGIQVNNSYANFNNSNIFMNGNTVYFRNVGDASNYIRYDDTGFDGFAGLEIAGFNGVKIGITQSGSYRRLIQSTSYSPFRAYANYNTNSQTYLDYSDSNQLGGVVNGGYAWFFTSYGRLICDSILTTGSANIRNDINFTAFRKTTGLNNWITDTHGDDGKSKVVIGNLGDAIGGDMPCLGGHNTVLGAWTDMWINPVSSTYFGNVIVNGAFSNPSDRRIKTDISYLNSGKSINFIKALKPCIFRRCDKIDDPYLKEDEEQPVRRLEHGFIAQDIEEVAETEAQKLIVNIEQYKGEERKTITLLSLIPEIVQGMKELIDKNERLETENKTLIERIEAIELKLLKNAYYLKN